MKTNSGFRHYRYKKQGVTTTKGGVTLAYTSPKHLDDLTKEDTVAVAFSFCSGEDNFCRRFGRGVAEKRLDAGDLLVPGDMFRNLVRQHTPETILMQMDGFNWEQHREFARRLRATSPTC